MNIRSFLVLLWLVIPFNVYADTLGSAQLAAFVGEVKTFEARFNQTVIGPDGQVLEEAQGDFLLQRPGKFRWNYVAPYPQQIIADGEQIWFYDVDLEQVTVRSQQTTLADTPATLLSGKSLPAEKYNIKDVRSEDGLNWVELTPKQADSNYQIITLAFDESELRQMIMRDSFDQRTRLTFSQVRENRQLADTAFQFTPPEGVDVVGESAE
jgi:outer membrane lipoprotein carrier protein